MNLELDRLDRLELAAMKLEALAEAFELRTVPSAWTSAGDVLARLEPGAKDPFDAERSRRLDEALVAEERNRASDLVSESRKEPSRRVNPCVPVERRRRASDDAPKPFGSEIPGSRTLRDERVPNERLGVNANERVNRTVEAVQMQT